MSSRKPGYVISVVLLAIVLSAPQVITVIGLTWEGISSRRWPLPSIPGFEETVCHAPLHRLPFWANKFVQFCDFDRKVDGGTIRKISLIDPETGNIEKLSPVLEGKGFFQAVVIGDRIWFVDPNGITESYELIDGDLRRSDFASSKYPSSERQLFLLGDDPAIIEYTKNGCEVFRFQNGGWNSIGILALPHTGTGWNVCGVPMNGGGHAVCQVFDSKDGIHVFMRSNEYLFHHQGLEIVPILSSSDVNGDGANISSGMPVSALNAQNLEEDHRGWSLVRQQPVTKGLAGISQVLHGLLIEGKPAALIVDDVRSGNAMGRLYRLEGTTWNEFASMRFPFGSISFVVVTTVDSERSYVGVRTTRGTSYVYALEASGFRETKGSAAVKTMGFESWVSTAFEEPVFYCAILTISLTLGLFNGLLTWPLMRWYTTADYGFGLHSVKLASLGSRGCARLIDLGFIGGSAFLLGWLMTRGIDWYAFFEALNLHVGHPSIRSAQRAAMFVAVWLVGLGFVLLMSQAIWGITLGKWLCGLRTVRTNLRRCGFARSLAREIVFFVDCCNFLCWTLGIVSIAFTDKRQRLGDLVAETIVVESQSLDSSNEPGS